MWCIMYDMLLIKNFLGVCDHGLCVRDHNQRLLRIRLL
jgi:hypothetical protein